ncbi:10 kDa heat shock protein-like protein [Dinothrombium tinctorium]|uniref:10 kDa heat shock protein, mitochondrial n=1 Tax=Dinothrombium tinctorium TaxID=1965070 RepID=A0A443QD97_9ACAR|nr:10 kDa heat shock protein-like protein [Dinothrombium tinctorium]
MSQIGRGLVPLLDRVLIERFAPETKTKVGIMIPEKALNKVQSGTVVAVGPGARNEKGYVMPVSVKVGNKVLLPEYGGHKIEIDDKEIYLFRDSDILGKREN